MKGIRRPRTARRVCFQINNQQSPNQQSLLRLGDAARAAGVTVQQLQYYLMVGLIEPATKSAGDQRLFDRRALKKIRMVKLLNQSGYALREIREIFFEPKTRSPKSKVQGPKSQKKSKSKRKK